MYKLKRLLVLNNFKAVASGLNVKPLQEYLEDNPELWNLITARQDAVDFHKDTQTIFIRGPLEMTVDSYFNTDSAIDYPIPQDLALLLIPLLDHIYKNLNPTKIGRILLVILKPSGQVQTHVDVGMYAKSYSRFHLAVSTSVDNFIFCETEKQHIKAGDVWWFNHRKKHSAANSSQKERIHLILDLETSLFQIDQEGL